MIWQDRSLYRRVRSLVIVLALLGATGWATFASYSESWRAPVARPGVLPIKHFTRAGDDRLGLHLESSLASQADLSLTNIASPAGSVATSSQITYTIKVNNNGPDSATNVTVNDPIPRGDPR